MIRETVKGFANVKVDSWSGLLIDYCKERKIPAIVKGLRAVSDFDYELQMAQMNRQLSGIETLFMATRPEFSFLSSSLVKELATYGGDVTTYVPAPVHASLVERIGGGKQ